MTTQTTTTPARVALDIVYGARDEPTQCGICRNPIPPTPAAFELILADTDDETPICGPCSHATHKPLAAALIFLTALTKAYEAGDTYRVGEGIQAVMTGMDLWHAESGTPIPTTPAPRRPRTAPARRRRRR